MKGLKARAVTGDHIRELFGHGETWLPRAEAAEKLQEIADIGRSAAYDALKYYGHLIVKKEGNMGLADLGENRAMDGAKHILLTSAGVVVTKTVNDADAFRCAWEPAPPCSRKKLKRIAREYRPWPNRILAEWAKRTGLQVLVVEV